MTPLSSAIAEAKKNFSESTKKQVEKINHEIVKIENRLPMNTPLLLSDQLNIVTYPRERLHLRFIELLKKSLPPNLLRDMLVYTVPPEKIWTHYKDLRSACERYCKSSRLQTMIIPTMSVFFLREIHMYQKLNPEFKVRYFRIDEDGTITQAETMDGIGKLENLDEEVAQAERYMELEMGLTPRNTKA